MAVGTLLVATGGFSSVVELAGVPVYAPSSPWSQSGRAAVLTPLLDLGEVPRGVDETTVPQSHRAPVLFPGTAS
jgi:hypothetical protein